MQPGIRALEQDDEATQGRENHGRSAVNHKTELSVTKWLTRWYKEKSLQSFYIDTVATHPSVITNFCRFQDFDECPMRRHREISESANDTLIPVIC